MQEIGLSGYLSFVRHQGSTPDLHGLLPIQTSVWLPPLGGGGVLDVVKEEWEDQLPDSVSPSAYLMAL